ncbi:UvrD-helicase domain-containing protein [uncultured Roseobacter sp.]|uniref:UvrD-helicase domain-containing protein n=1 Tax=uncultured Roseobacter sp. TaxID=114847 RepID=UPI0026361486|nr:UvrD-helicase domain-containing protein [uncultured Roseobacter sp.]
MIFPLQGESDVALAGVRRAHAEAFVTSLNAAWRSHFAKQVDKADAELRALAEVVGWLEQPRRYPSACLLQPFLIGAVQVLDMLPESIPDGVLPDQQRKVLDAVIRFQQAPEEMRDAAVKAFVDAELVETKEFTDVIESNPLTPEQRLAVVTDEDATLVLAGAGSGKTSVIVAKASYLINRGIRKPDEILLTAFGKEAAAEMASRIEERSGAVVDALTFHALGNRIIREVESGSPALAPHASEDKLFSALLRDILFEDVASMPGLGSVLLKWFSEFYWPYKSEWDFKTKDEYYQYVEGHELRTLQGDLVKSFEEWEIANWLYLNGIASIYEPDYEHDRPHNDLQDYTPDFRLIDSGVFIEHFGARRSQSSDGSYRLTTAPHVDRDAYLAGMEWKRKVHEENGTILIETYSYERVEGNLTDALAEKIAPYVAADPIPQDQVFDRLSELGQVDGFTQTLGTFLRHFKSSGGSVEQCRARAQKSQDAPRANAFMMIFAPLLGAYQRRLGDRIDFEDMIVRATEHVKSGRYHSPYRHLIVDEFQDISEGRAKLLLALKEQHADARIFAVGDDWQSIYRFTGADIHLMRDFGREFGGTFNGQDGIHSTVDLGRTFRSVDKIALPARSFVLQNPSQIKKQVIPFGKTEETAIRIAYYARGGEEHALRSALDGIGAAQGDKTTSVLLLGRCRFLKPDNLRSLTSSSPNLSIRFMTVHASKGLEADHVIILGAVTHRMGFPSEIVDDPLLDLVLPAPEKFDHAEERRLFYVALTRARKSVIVLADREKPSVFARELAEKPEYGATELGEAGIAEHRCGACGGRMLAQTSKKGRRYFRCEHRYLCGETRSPCPECRTDLPVVDKAQPGYLVCSCGEKFSACPQCSDGWLVKRNGKWGKFLSCTKYPKCSGKQSLPKEWKKRPRKKTS